MFDPAKCRRDGTLEFLAECSGVICDRASVDDTDALGVPPPFHAPRRSVVPLPAAWFHGLHGLDEGPAAAVRGDGEFRQPPTIQLVADPVQPGEREAGRGESDHTFSLVDRQRRGPGMVPGEEKAMQTGIEDGDSEAPAAELAAELPAPAVIRQAYELDVTCSRAGSQAPAKFVRLAQEHVCADHGSGGRDERGHQRWSRIDGGRSTNCRKILSRYFSCRTATAPNRPRRA